MIKKLCLFVSILFLFISFTFAEDFVYIYRDYIHIIDTELEDAMENSSSEELFQVIVEFDRLIDTEWMYSIVKGMNKQERREFTITTLKEFTAAYQEDVYGYLESMQNVGDVERLNQLWLTNSIGMKATREVIEEVSKHPTVALIWHDKYHLKPHLIKVEGRGDNTPESRAIVWNVLQVNADDVWTLGYTGENIIVGHIDTGVNYNHNDLNDHLWDGGASYPNHGWDFEDNDNDPMDPHGHGTHTSGTVAGDGTAGTQTGVAPDAQIMCLKALGPLSTLQAAVNFALTNGASVMSMSAGWDSAAAGGSWNYLSTQNRYLLNNCLNAAVTFVTSAGNGKQPGHYLLPYDVGIPANSPCPWYGSAGHSACMAVGATNQSYTVASFSSRGPSDWWFSPWYEYQYPPGLLKPDICAPGGSPGITSLSRTNNNGYVGGYSWQGTSMSCPHVSGAIALLLEKDPSLTPEDLDSILETTSTDLGTTGRDTYYGAGFLNCLAAVNAVGIEEEPTEILVPSKFTVNCYPNPAAHSTTILFTLPHKSDITLDIIDVTGRKIAKLTSGEFEGGNHQTVWERKSVPKGVYFIRLRAEGKEHQGKLILL